MNKRACFFLLILFLLSSCDDLSDYYKVNNLQMTYIDHMICIEDNIGDALHHYGGGILIVTMVTNNKGSFMYYICDDKYYNYTNSKNYLGLEDVYHKDRYWKGESLMDNKLYSWDRMQGISNVFDRSVFERLETEISNRVRDNRLYLNNYKLINGITNFFPNGIIDVDKMSKMTNRVWTIRYILE